MSEFATTESCTKGLLPSREYDIHCPLMGGPEYKMNYHSFSCRERQLNKTCSMKDCKRRVNLVRPGVVQNSAAAEKIEMEAEDMGKKTIKACADCGREMAIVARGLCGKCFRVHKKAGTLDKKYPAKHTKRKAKNLKSVVESDVVNGDDAGAFNNDPLANNDVNKAGHSSPANVSASPGCDDLTLCFEDRDSDLIDYLDKWADLERRSLPDQILFILDNVVAERKASEAN